MTAAPDDLIQLYQQIESQIQVEHHLNRVTYQSPINFNKSLTIPRHRWYPYKEGFSPSFVQSFLQRNTSNAPLHILDPFGGVGTTILEATLQGHSGLGIEVSPLAVFIARAKAINLDSTGLSKFCKVITAFENASLYEVANAPQNKTVVSYFGEEYLEALLKVKAFLETVEEDNIKSVLKVAFLSIIETFSTHRKAGNGLKRKTKLNYSTYPGSNAIEKVQALISHYLHQYYQDLQSTIQSENFEFVQQSSLTFDYHNYHKKFNAVLTSPPYANCFDYSKIYMCELWLGDFFESVDTQKEFRRASLRSHVHARWESRYADKGSTIVNNLIFPVLRRKRLWSKQIPDMLRGYFMDLGYLFSRLQEILEPNSPVGFVVGNSVYGGIPVATDLLIADLAQQHGFTVERIEVYRRIVPSSQQFVQVENKEYLRESVVVLRKG